jgi:hypothetical protein
MRRLRGTAIAALLVTAGCGSPTTGSTTSSSSSPAEPVSAADCSSQVRADGVVYTSHSFTERPATAHGTAEVAACHDTGQSPAGSVFTDDAERVRTWVFEGYPASQVLGVRVDRTTYAVHVADDLSRAQRERIARELGR